MNINAAQSPSRTLPAQFQSKQAAADLQEWLQDTFTRGLPVESGLHCQGYYDRNNSAICYTQTSPENQLAPKPTESPALPGAELLLPGAELHPDPPLPPPVRGFGGPAPFDWGQIAIISP